MKATSRRARTHAHALILAMCAAVPAHANFTCSGNITYLGLNYHGATLYFTSSANTSNGAECTALGSWVMPNPLPYFIQVSGG